MTEISFPGELTLNSVTSTPLFLGILEKWEGSGQLKKESDFRGGACFYFMLKKKKKTILLLLLLFLTCTDESFTYVQRMCDYYDIK